jgi:sulfate adenylyltransferase small subunit
LPDGTQPFKVGTQRCCGLLKTKALLDGLESGNFDAAIGGARRDEERSRAKERVFSVRDPNGQWDPKRQRPELWNLLNGKLRPGESIRVFPLSNWTELDVWHYIAVENIPIVPLYFAKEREVIVRGNSLIVQEQPFVVTMPGEKPQIVKCRMRSLGCSPCTGAIRSDADTVPKIINELIATRQSERQLRIIDHDQDGSMELKKREATSDGGAWVRNQRPLAHLHGRQRRRWEEHADWTAAVRLAVGVRGSGQFGREGVEEPERGAHRFLAVHRWSAAEREQGITIDVAYRYFATARRKFILADTPGHEQYTRNMATGASTADVAILLIDARNGVRAAVEAPRAHCADAGHPGLRPGHQQDGSRGLRRGRL